MAKIYGALEVAQLEWFTQSPDTRPSAASNTYRVIYASDVKQAQISDGTNWISIGSRVDTYTSGTLPAAVAGNTNQVVYVSDLQQLQVSTGSVWVSVGSKAGTKNYFASNNLNYDFESNSTANWSLANSTLDATTKLPNQAAGSWTAASANLSISAVGAGNQLAGSYSLALTQATAASVAGNMLVSSAITLDKEAQASVQTFSFFYQIASGATNLTLSGTSTNSIGVAVYVVDGSFAGTWIQPAGVYNIVQKTGVGKCAGTFQVPIDATQVRLAVYFPNASAGTFSVYLDDFFLGPQVVQYGAPVTDWQSYTPTFTNLGTVTGTDFKWRRVGGVLEIIGYGKSGTVASNQRFTLPSGLNIDTSIAGVSATNTLGFFNRLPAAAGSTVTTGGLFYDSALGTQVLRLQTRSDTGLYETTATAAISNNEGFSCRAFVPIQGWSSSVQTSDSTDTRVVSFSAFRNATQAVTADVTDVLFAQVNKDSHGAFSGNNTYTIPVAGDYTISASIGDNAAASLGIRLYVNTVQYRTLCFTPSGQPGSGTIIVPNLKAGDTITIRSSVSLTLSVGGYLSIQRISGPSAIAASETVALRYTNTAGSSYGTSDTLMPFATKDYDTHSAWATNTFTAPISGKYLIHCTFTSGSTGIALDSKVYKNGSSFCQLGYGYSTGSTRAIGMATVSLNAGDTISIYASSNVAGSLSTTAGLNHFSITRVGN